jgi:hypothetical protein
MREEIQADMGSGSLEQPGGKVSREQAETGWGGVDWEGSVNTRGDLV